MSIGSIGWKTYVYFSVFNACFIPAIYFFCKFDRHPQTLRSSHLHQSKILRPVISRLKRSTACLQARKLSCTLQSPRLTWRRCAPLRSRRLRCRESTQSSASRSDCICRQYFPDILSSYRNAIVMKEAAIPTTSRFKLRSRVSRTAKKHGVASGYTCR